MQNPYEMSISDLTWSSKELDDDNRDPIQTVLEIPTNRLQAVISALICRVFRMGIRISVGWVTLTEFVKHLRRSGIAKVDEEISG